MGVAAIVGVSGAVVVVGVFVERSLMFVESGLVLLK